MAAWVAAKSQAQMRAILSSEELSLSPARWRAFWRTYAPSAPTDRRSPASRFAAEQLEAAEFALTTVVAESSRLAAAVARTYTRDYWLALYGEVERQRVARRQARFLIVSAAPGWAFDPRWRTSEVTGLAAAVRSTGDYSLMPIVADALQDAGCENHEWLSLMRDPAQPWFVGAPVLESLG
jgi:hypothetical protein